MTAPDSRDSVERIVAEMRGLWMSGAKYATARGVKEWADRLAALPQQAGGEDSGLLQWARNTPAENGWKAKERDEACEKITSLQAEVARLQGALHDQRWQHAQELKRAETAEAALREAGRDAERYRWLRNCDSEQEDRVMLRDPENFNRDELLCGTELDAAIDAAIEQASR